MNPEPPATPLAAPVVVAAPIASPLLSSQSAAIGPDSPRTVRWIELVLLLAVSFGAPMYASVAVFAGTFTSGRSLSRDWSFYVLQELTALGLCAYLLHKQGRSFGKLGLNFRWSDPLLAIGIMILSLVATYMMTCGIYYSGHYLPADRARQAETISRTVGSEFVWGMVAFNVINAFYEELIVRAYLIKDLTLLTGSTALAVVVSAVFQGFYHLYQGWQAALSATCGFLVFSLFYARTHRIAPVIFAHLLWDLMVLMNYFYWYPHKDA